MTEFELSLRAEQYLRPYPTHGKERKIACVLFVLEILSPFSQEIKQLEERLRGLDFSLSKKELIQSGYFLKFIRGTGLRLLEPEKPEPGDILLLKEYSSRIDHLGLYIGNDLYVHLDRARGDRGGITSFSGNRGRVLKLARAELGNRIRITEEKNG
ncbi:MAG: hypothetical protein ACE5GM_03175 [bacterium]